MTSRTPAPVAGLTAAVFHLAGCVQGVGMRPAVARLAVDLGLSGHVRNTPDGVSIVVEGSPADIRAFADQLPDRIPSAADLRQLTQQEIRPGSVSGFHVDTSDQPSEPVSTLLPTDLAVCGECLEDVLDPENVRRGYAFTSCTNCGPRYSLTADMPWDRNTCSMSEFPLCDDCSAEYESAADRRFHAQTNCCPACGPRLTFHSQPGGEFATGPGAIEAAAQVVIDGGIVALKGIGGYQLVCDATSSTAVRRLRAWKRRPAKPLAVMVKSLDAAERLATVTEQARMTLQSSANPITLMNVRNDRVTPLCAGVHPNLNQTGIMLPGSPLHFLLLQHCDRPCVVTSGNISRDPLVYQDDEPSGQLWCGVDAVLTHNRRILRPVDDSVVRPMGDHVVTVRSARGLAPLPLPVAAADRILAVGAHQKVSLALSNGAQAILGPHLGDLDSLSMRQRFVEQADRLCELYRTRPRVIAHDLHPDLFTTRWAHQQDCRTIAVQHHHAHVVSGMVEHEWLDGEVLGVAFDGTGLGTDGTIWGGEFLRCTVSGFQRVARLRPFALPGGEQAIREPWRVAVALLYDSVGAGQALRHMRRLMSAGLDVDMRRVENLLRLLERQPASNVGCSALFPVTSSAGRLFDGLAALLLGVGEASFEGEPAMRLESVCRPDTEGAYQLNTTNGELAELDWRPMVREALADMTSGTHAGPVAMRIMRGLAGAIADICQRFGNLPVILSGGCFQNAILTEAAQRMIQARNQVVGLHGRIPPNDGGLAAGQLAIAAAHLQQDSARPSQEGIV